MIGLRNLAVRHDDGDDGHDGQRDLADYVVDEAVGVAAKSRDRERV